MDEAPRESADALKVLIVDDEAPARALMRRYVDRHGELDCVGEAGSGSDAVQACLELEPELILLDIEMPTLDGFSVLEELGSRSAGAPTVIFVTAYDRYAVRAFEAQALDFLLKPVSEERFEKAIERCLEERVHKEPSAPSIRQLLGDALHRPPERFLVRRGDRIVPVPVEEIDWVEASGDYVNIHVAGSSHLIERTLTDIERLLAPRSFLRIHRSTLVNERRIQELRSLGSGRYQLFLEDGTRLVVSRKYAQLFRDQLL